MNSRFSTLSLDSLLRSGGEAMVAEDLFGSLCAKLRKALARHEEGVTLFIDLFGLNVIPKVSMAEEILDIFGSYRPRLGNVFFYNTSASFYASLQQPLLSHNFFPSSLQVTPFILADGEWRWLGLSNDRIHGAVNTLVKRRILAENTIQHLFDISPLEIEIFRAVLEANPSYFAYDYKSRLAKTGFDAVHLVKETVRHEGRLLKKEFDECRVTEDGHFILPSGHHINKCVLISRVPQCPPIYERMYAQVSRMVWATAPDKVLTSSLVSFMIGERLRRDHGLKVIHTFGYPVPRPRYSETTAENERAFILTDIYSTGAAMNHLRKQVIASQGVVVGAMCLVDAHGRGEKDEVVSSIRLGIPLKKEGNCLRCKDEAPSYFLDPFSCLPFRPLPKMKVRPGVLGDNEFWSMAHENNAITDKHLIYNGNHFTIFVETRKMLRDPPAALELAARGLSTFGPNFDFILIPKNEGALLLAQAIQEYLQQHFGISPEVITCARDHERNGFIIPELGDKSFKGASVLVVDDGANTGHTLLGLHFAVRPFRPKRVKYLVFLDRLTGTDRQSIDHILGRDYLFLYHLGVPVYREWDCPFCLSRENQRYYSTGRQVTQKDVDVPLRSAGPRSSLDPTHEVTDRGDLG